MTLKETIVKVMEKYSLFFDEDIIIKLQNYIQMLIEYPVNLTSVKNFEKAFETHVIDSLIPTVKNSFLKEEKNCVDVGTGGGIPGIVWAICYPKSNFYLVESIAKKTKALNIFKEKLELKNVKIFNNRVEDFALDYKNFFDIATSKAVARADIALEYIAPLVKKDGYVTLFKGPLFFNLEDSYAVKSEKILRIKKIDILKYYIEEEEKERYFITYLKTENTKKDFPREIGAAKKNPLGGK